MIVFGAARSGGLDEVQLSARSERKMQVVQGGESRQEAKRGAACKSIRLHIAPLSLS